MRRVQSVPDAGAADEVTMGEDRGMDAQALSELLSILQEFAARGINLTKLESRPTRRGLGDYCFLIDLEGHIADEVVADALRSLKSKHAEVKFMGSYPAAGERGHALRQEVADAQSKASDWIAELRNRVD